MNRETLEDVYNDEFRQECLYKIVGIYNIIDRQLEKLFAPFGISASKFNILMVIKHQASSPEGISQVEISKKLLIGTANVAKLTDRLLKDGYITRRAQEKDRRFNFIQITEKGSKLLDDVWILYTQEVEKITQSLNLEERKLAISVLEKWLENLSQQSN